MTRKKPSSLKVSADEWKLLAFLDGRKTYLLVAVLMAWVGYRVEFAALPMDDAMGWIIASLLPLAVNSTNRREHEQTRRMVNGRH